MSIIVERIVRGALLLAAAAALLLISFGTVAHYQGASTAKDLCDWLNGSAVVRPKLAMGPQTQAILDELRATGTRVECTTGGAAHADSFLTETAILVHPQHGHAIGLRIAALGSSPHVLGYWTP